MTWLDIISSACRLIGVLASGETLPNDIASDALMVAQGMIDSWTADRLTVYTINIDTFPMVPGQQVYTYGPGGNFNATRPAKLERASIVSLSNPNQPLELPIDILTDLDWQNVPVKNIQTTLPSAVYDDGAYPFRNLSFWPIPTVNVNTILYSWSPLTQPAKLTSTVAFPPGYQEAFRYNLAMRLIAEMPGNYNQIMVSTTGLFANESLARIKSINEPIIQATIDPTLLGISARYNFYTDEPVGGRQGS